MLCQNSIYLRPFLLDSVLLCSLAQVPSSEALATFFQTTFRVQDNSYPLMVKGEVTTDINSSQTSFKLFDNLASQMEIWDHPIRTTFINEQSLCPQVKSHFLGTSSFSALLIDDCLFSGMLVNHALSELNENAIIWLDMPMLKLSGSNKRIIPIFRVTRVINSQDQLTIKAQPLNCDQCPHRLKNSNLDSKCCGGCEDNSKPMISDADLDVLSRKVTQDHSFEPVEIKYRVSTNELNVELNTTQGVFTTLLSQHPTGLSFLEDRQSSVMPLILLLSAATLVQPGIKE